jgi:hypothetical protein
MLEERLSTLELEERIASLEEEQRLGATLSVAPASLALSPPGLLPASTNDSKSQYETEKTNKQEGSALVSSAVVRYVALNSSSM